MFVYAVAIVALMVYGVTDICRSIQGVQKAIEEQTRVLREMEPSLLQEIALDTGDLRKRIGDYMRNRVYPAGRDGFK